MRCSTMRLLPLALLCLLVGQAAAARTLSQTVKFDPTKNKQYVQIAMTFAGKCSALVDGPRLLRDGALQDVKNFLNARNLPDAADSAAGRLNDTCRDFKDADGSDLAAIKTSISFMNPAGTAQRNQLTAAARKDGCEGGYNQAVYAVLAATFKTNSWVVKYNNANSINPSVRWIPYVSYTNCPPSPSPTPSPSPSPEPSPSPSPEPSPSPSPAPVNCSALVPNSVNDGAGNCVCTAAGFTVSGYNGTTLVACLATGITACPSPYTASAKNSASTIVMCLANIDACPALYPFPLVAGNPASIVECRPAGSACTFTNFNVPISPAGSNSVVGCVRNDGQCPAAYPVAYREYQNSFALQKCDNATSCRAWTQTTTTFTTPALTTSGQLAGCFTLEYTKTTVLAAGAAGTCPSSSVANFPINVISSDPDSTGLYKTVTCLAANASCPQSSPILLFAQTVAGVPPTQTGCAPLAVLVNGACPTTTAATNTWAGTAGYPIATGPYSVRVGTSDQLLGCSAALTSCPAAYPFPTTQSGSTTLSNCSPTGTTTTCSGGSIPAVDIAGNTVACLGAIANCPSTYPITVRAAGGTVIECRALGASCPATGSNFPYYAATQAGQVPTIKECWPKPTTDGCFIQNYALPIYTNDTKTNANLLGCVDSTGTTTECPTAAPVAYKDGTSLALAECRSSAVTTCQTAPSIYVLPVVDAANKLLVCLTGTSCPATQYSISVTTLVTGGTLIKCMPTTSQACPIDFSFMLVDASTTTAVLKQCLPPQTSATNCAGYTGFTGATIYPESGAGVLLGCTTANPMACPAGYPFTFWQATGVTGSPVWSISECRTRITTTCSLAKTGYSVNAKDSLGAVVGCVNNVIAAGVNHEGCPTKYPVQVATSSLSLLDPVDCYVQGASCPATATTMAGTTINPTFPLYDGATQPGTVAKLVGCVPVKKLASGSPASVCTGVDNYGTVYQVPVYSDAAGTILVGCLKGNAPGTTATSGSSNTPCPTGTTPLILAAGTNINECRGNRNDCTFSSTSLGATAIDYSTYKVLVKDTLGNLKGCLEKATASQCPLAAVVGTIVAEAYPFVLMGPSTSTSTDPDLLECRPTPSNIANCAATPYGTTYPLNLLSGAGGTLEGCLRAPAGDNDFCVAAGSYTNYLYTNRDPAATTDPQTGCTK